MHTYFVNMHTLFTDKNWVHVVKYYQRLHGRISPQIFERFMKLAETDKLIFLCTHDLISDDEYLERVRAIHRRVIEEYCRKHFWKILGRWLSLQDAVVVLMMSHGKTIFDIGAEQHFGPSFFFVPFFV